MDKPLVYIDQNIIGLQADGVINLGKVEQFCWVYSKEHFAEIRRSNSPECYLEAIEKLDAKLLDLELDLSWKITGRANLILDKMAYEHYESYLEANGDVEMDDAIFDPFLSWVNGGGEQDLFEQLPEKIADEVLSLTNSYANETADIRQDVNRISADFKNTIDKMTSHGNDIDKTRSMMGVGKGAVGSIKGEKALFKIWELISSACGEMSSDQFFGFEPFDMQGYEKWPTYLGIVGCCAVLDIIGFQAEKKCRKIEKIPNVRSDYGHLEWEPSVLQFFPVISA